VQDGLGSSHVIGLLEDRTGRLCAVTKAPGRLYVNGFDGVRFQAVALPVSALHYGSGWLGWYQVLAQASDGEWWVASKMGLLRFSSVDLTHLSPSTLLHRYGVQDGLGGNHVFKYSKIRRRTYGLARAMPPATPLASGIRLPLVQSILPKRRVAILEDR
jgi:hypothetical protein